MNNLLKQLYKDRLLLIGLLLFLLSTLVFIAGEYSFTDEADLFTTTFFIQYALSITYMIALMFSYGRTFFIPFSPNIRDKHITLLLLFNLSAYGLNKSIHVFQSSTDWLVVLLVVESIVLLYYALFTLHNKRGRKVLIFLFTILLLFNFYQSIIVLPLYGIGIVASPFLAISLHVFVPITFFTCFLIVVIDLYEDQKDLILIGSALVTVIVICSIFAFRWKQIDKLTTEKHHESHQPPTQFNQSSELPSWVDLAKALPFNAVTEKYLKSGLIYQEFYDGDNIFWDANFLRFQGQQRHDPLVTITTFFTGRPKIGKEARLKILDYAYDARHESVDRFWSGLNLKTTDVVSNVQLYPSFRLAYTELILRISNEQFKERSTWFSQEEAIYTFQLPEGSVISSLSLWIRGKEEPARLTTKEKAEEAYSTIVGREARDPSAVYWMEGNKIRVRVFPCTPEEARQFKLGITSPLKHRNNQLTYESITFKGPDFSQSEASINIISDHNSLEILSSSINFERETNQLRWKGNYKPNWSIVLKAPPLSNSTFTFNEKTYSLTALQNSFTKFNPSAVYIDLNKNWTDQELEATFKALNQKTIYTFDSKGTLFELKSRAELLELERPNFSLFPFHELKTNANAFVITKGDVITPNLSDLKNSGFYEKLFNSFTSESKCKVFDIGPKPSNYIKSLKEFSAIHYYSGNLNELTALIESSRYPTLINAKSAVTIPTAEIQIERANIKGDDLAPDHLLRLFAYNQLMKDIGSKYFQKDFINDELIGVASEANIVTPISSLIVLETLDDYERFEIDENKDSLGNAKINSSGAVPEPHEWAIIICLTGFILFIWLKKRSVYA